MKKLYKAILYWQIAVFSVITYTASYAQTKNIIEQDFNRYQQKYPQEKIYAHTNKGFYVTGELLWFKLYLVNSSNQPSKLSKVAYAELIDAGHNAVLQGKIAIKQGSGNGSFYIPLTLANGNYKLRAYTNWMKNNGPESFFEKTLSIVNPLKSPAEGQVKAAQANDFDIQFFPEGGDLVRNLTSRVAFKMVGANGRGMMFRGAVINQQNDTIIRFTPARMGMGSFAFTPVAGNTYRAVVQVPGNRPVYKPLPQIRNEGYALQVTDAGSNISINVAGSTGLNNNIYSLIYNGNKVVDARNMIAAGASGQISIPKSRLANGVNHILIFDNNRQPVAERLYFKRPTAKPMQLTAATNQQQYGLRKPVTLDLTTNTGTGSLAPADLSVSVYKIDSLQKTEGGNLYNYLWLGAELKGSIETPEYYFEHIDRQADEALDNLMLTQGWRRFNWSNITNPAYMPAYLPEYTGHLITARLIDSTSGQPKGNIIAYLSSPAKYTDLYTARSDSAGRLIFETKNFYGEKELVLQTNTRQDSTYRVELQSPFSEKYSDSPAGGSFQLNPSAEADLKSYSLGMQLQNVYTGSKLRQYYSPGIDSLSFYLTPYKTYKLDDYTRFTTMEEVLREYVGAISVTNRQRHFHIRAIDETNFLEDEPLVTLDGIPIFNIDKVFAIDPLKVQKLDLVRNRYFYGPATFEGVLSFTTYKGDLGGFEIDPHAVVLDYEGLQLQREFYSPVYGTVQQLNSRLPDFRNTLFWEPNAGTNAQGRNTIQFYTSDVPGKYIINVQGITAGGDAGSKQLFFEVKK